MLKGLDNKIEENDIVHVKNDHNIKEVVKTKKEKKSYNIDKMILDEIDEVVKEYKEE